MRGFLRRDDAVLHVDFRRGDPVRRAIVFANSLGTDMRIWDAVIALLPEDRPVLRVDKRGHGLSDLSPVTMDILANDMDAAMAQFDIANALVCGVSVGGMIAQSLAARHPHRVAGLVLSNTGQSIGTPDIWNRRIDAVRKDGVASIAEAILERWFSPGFLASHPDEVDGYRNMLTRTPDEGYARMCETIRDTDLTGMSGAISAPALCVAGSADLATPEALVRDLSRALSEARFHLIDGAGHLPCLETPDIMAGLIMDMDRQL